MIIGTLQTTYIKSQITKYLQLFFGAGMLCALLTYSIFPSEISAVTSDTKKPTNVVSACVNLTQDIIYQSTDAKTKGQVSMLQKFLKGKGYYTGAIDGFWGTTSISALRKYQASVRISDIGIADLKTRTRIKTDTCTQKELGQSTQSLGTSKKTATSTKKITSTSNSSKNSNTTSDLITVTKTISYIKDASGRIIGSTTTVTTTGNVGKDQKLILVGTNVKATSSRLTEYESPKGKIQILEPYGGMVLKAGYPAVIRWGAEGYREKDHMRLVLLNDSSSEIQKFDMDQIDEGTDIDLRKFGSGFKAITTSASSLTDDIQNQGMYTWSVPDYLPSGVRYRIFIAPVNDLSKGIIGSEAFSISGKNLVPHIARARVSHIGNIYLVNITGSNFTDDMSVKFLHNGLIVGNVDSYQTNLLGSTEMQFSMPMSELNNMPLGQTYQVVVYNESGASNGKDVVFQR